MRSIIIMGIAVLALAGCGQPKEAAPSAVPLPADAPAWRVALGDDPAVVARYSAATGLAALGGAAAKPLPDDSVEITTPAQYGAWAAMLVLGPEAQAERPTAIRATVSATRGALFVLTIYDKAPSTHQPYQIIVRAGETQTVYLPIDKSGPPLLIVSNASNFGDSQGSVRGIEMLAPH